MNSESISARNTVSRISFVTEGPAYGRMSANTVMSQGVVEEVNHQGLEHIANKTIKKQNEAEACR